VRPALVIAGKDLRQRVRDRSAMVVAFVAPIALASIISAAFGSSPGLDFHATFVVVDHDRSALSEAFVGQVLGGDELAESVEVIRAEDIEGARSAVRRDTAQAGFVIPAGFTSDVAAGREVEMTVLRTPQAPVSAQFAEGLANGFLEQVRTGRLSVMTALQVGGGDPAALAQRAAQLRPSVLLTFSSVGERGVGDANYFGPSMAIFFLFFTVGWGARSLLIERRQGTLARLMAAPVSPGTVMAGKALSVFVLGVASLVTMFVVMGVAFGVHWGDPVALGVLTVATVLALMAVTTTVAALARTDEQADSYSSMVAISLALLGGSFFPVHQMPDFLRAVSLATPNGWAIRGFTDLAYEGGGVGSIGTHVAAIGAFTVAMGAVAIVATRRMVAR
jgi:ABC-2 type transport system permease protein